MHGIYPSARLKPSPYYQATVAEGVVGTMATVALFALMMDASDPDHAGTDFTLLASVVVGVGSLGGIAGGVVGDAWGYVWAFGIGTVLSALGCVAMVTWLDRRSGQILHQQTFPVGPQLAQQASNVSFAPEVGHSLATAQQEAAQRLGARIVDLMEAPW